jgi:hypothetical protein
MSAEDAWRLLQISFLGSESFVMLTRRFVIRVLCLSLIVLGIGLAIRDSAWSPLSKEPVPTAVSINLGDAQLRFPEGVHLDAGTVPENAFARFSLSFINDGPGTVDSARFQICETCNGGVRLMKSQQRIAAGESGVVEFELPTRSRVGRTTVNAQVEYAAIGPVPESSKNSRFAVLLSFTNDSPGSCRWEHQTLDFGDLTADESPPSRRINFIQQLRNDLTPQIQLSSGESEEVSAKVLSERDAPSFLNLPGTAYEVEIKLQPIPGRKGHRREFVIAETPLGEQALEVQWNCVTDYVLRPSNGVFFTSPETTLTQVVSIRSMRSRVFRILSADCDIPNVEVVVGNSSFNSISQTISVRVPPRCTITLGQLSVHIREQSGDEHKEILPCRIVSLATEPTAAVAE